MTRARGRLSLGALVLLTLAGCGGSEDVDQSAQGSTDGAADGPDSHEASLTVSPKMNNVTVAMEANGPDAPGNAIDATVDVVTPPDVGADNSATDVGVIPPDVTASEAAADANRPDASADVSTDAAPDAKIADAGLDGDGCTGDACGSIVIGINICPQIQGYLISPITVAVGEAVHITSTATDADGDPLTYVWTANQGTFTAPNSPNTDFRCATAGTATLSLTVSDGICDDGIDQPITCL
jgi:hypothetical protein